MPFYPGQPGGPGRPPGSKTKFKLKTAMEVFEDTGFNPIEKLIEFANFGETEATRLKATADLSKYFAPQLKATEMNVSITAHEVALDELK